MEQIIEEYTYILVNKETGAYYGKSRHCKPPRNGDPENIEWIEWNKPLPDDIDEKEYTLEELEK